MQLRKSVTAPARFEDEVHVAPANRNGTKPAFPTILKDQIVPFNPNHPPAAFPSLPLTSVNVPAAGNLEGLEELVTGPTTLNSLSNEGLRISLAGSSLGEENISQVELRTIQPIAMQENTRKPVGSIVNEPNTAKVSSTGSEASCNVTWDLLPLALQFHIYKALSANYPLKIVPKLLGLTDHEASQIQKALGMRILHPASVEEIWNYCSNASVEGPGTLQPPSSIDADVFNEYVGYMVYASNYELAFDSEVRLAKDFLSSRGIATDLLGTWLPDPSDAQFGGLCRYVPGTMGKANLSNSQPHPDSGYSSFSEANQTPGAQCSERRLKSRQDSVKRKATEKRSTVPTAPASLIHSIQHRPASEHPLLDLNPNLVVRISPHPRSIFTKDGEFLNTLGGASSDARDPNEEIRPGVPQAEEHFRHRAGLDTPQQLATQSSEERSPIENTFNPQRLILKIQNKDGVARILRQKPSPKNWIQQISPPNSGNAAVSLKGLAKSSQPSALSFLPFGPDTSDSTKGPTMKDARRPLDSATFEVTFMRPATRPPVNFQSVAPDNSKRKPSQSDIRPDVSKVQRMLINVAPGRPSKTILQECSSDIDQLHTKANRCHELPTAHQTSASETDALSKARDVISSMESAEKMAGTVQGTIPLESMMPRSPPSPSYSPISENEDLKEFQARLRGPMMNGMRGKMLDQDARFSSQSDLTLALSLLSNAALLPPPKMGILPNDNQGQRENRVENHFKTRPRRGQIKLNDKEQGEERLESRSARSRSPSKQIQDTSQNVVNELLSGKEPQHQPLPSINAKVDRGMEASSGRTTSEPTFMTTLPTPKTQRKSPTQKKTGNKRGPRGPYRKTRERLAKLAVEEANAGNSKPT